jgi:hypothetical protein
VDRARLLLDDGRGEPRVLYDAGPAGSLLEGTGRRISSVRLSPDGTQAAFLLETRESPPAHPIGCGSEWVSRIELVVMFLSGEVKARSLLALTYHCALQ